MLIDNKPSELYITAYVKEINKAIDKTKVNSIIAGCGCGKSTLIKTLLTNSKTKVNVLAPYSISRKDYSSLTEYTESSLNESKGNTFQYITSLVNDMLLSSECSIDLQDITNVSEQLFTIGNNFAELLFNKHGSITFIFDELDFAFTQCRLTDYTKYCSSSKDLIQTLSGEVFLITLLNTLVTKHTVIGLSATVEELTSSLIEYKPNQIVIDMDSTVTFDKWTNVICPSDRGSQSYSLTKYLSEITSVGLIQSTRYTTKHLEIFKKYNDSTNKTIIIFLLKDKADVITTNDGDVQLALKHFGFNYAATVNDIKKGKVNYTILGSKSGSISLEMEDDSIYNYADVVAINTSNTRMESITKVFNTPPVVINLSNINVNSNTIQTSPRFRITPTIVYNLIAVKDKQSSVNLINQTKLIEDKIAKLSPIQHRYLKETIPTTILQTEKGKSVGKSKGKSISPTTQLRRDLLKEFLSTNPIGNTNQKYIKYLTFINGKDSKPLSRAAFNKLIKCVTINSNQ